jgi:hypothetical protein
MAQQARENVAEPEQLAPTANWCGEDATTAV